MKEHVEFITDSFVDYAGKTHHFVIVAISQNLPRYGNELESKIDSKYNDDSVYYDVSGYIDDYGTVDFLGTVSKVLRLGISICNPVDTFNKEIGIRKATARAYNNDPVIFASEPGVINTKMVKALLEQEAIYLKNNPENFIIGYANARDRYLTRQKMETMKKEFTEVENQVVEKLQSNPKFLDKVMQYLNWLQNQIRGCKQ